MQQINLFKNFMINFQKIMEEYTRRKLLQYMQLFPFSNLRYRNNNYLLSKMY